MGSSAAPKSILQPRWQNYTPLLMPYTIARSGWVGAINVVPVRSEVPGRIPEADIPNQWRQQGFVVGYFSSLDISANQVTEDPSEVFVSREGKKGAGVGRHSDESRKQTHAGKTIEVVDHALLLIQKPPGGSPS